MHAHSTLEPAGPLLVADLFPDLGRELVTLLRGLAPEDWSKPTVARAWSVHDLAAHLLDTALRRLSRERDSYLLPGPEKPIEGYRNLVGFLDEEPNASWVVALRRVSPPLLVSWIETAEAEASPLSFRRLIPGPRRRFPSRGPARASRRAGSTWPGS